MAPRKTAAHTALVAEVDASAKSDTVTINIALPRELHRELRVRAIREDMNIGEAVAAAVREWTA